MAFQISARLRRRGGELGGERDGFVRAEHQVNPRQLAGVSGPGLAVVGPARLEQPRHLGVSGHLARVDADRLRQDRGHVRSPRRSAVPAGVIGGEASAFLERPAGGVDWRRVDRLRGVFGEIPQEQPASRGGGDLAEVHHVRSAPF